MSRSPLYTPSETFYRPPDGTSPGRTVAVIFPSGLILEGDQWQVCAGYNDHAIKAFKIDHDELESNLISTVPEEQVVGKEAVNLTFSQRGRFIRVHWSPLDSFWAQAIEFVKEHRKEGEPVFADVRLQERFPETQGYENITIERLEEGTNWIILHKDNVDSIDLAVLDELKRVYTVAFANEVFVVFTNKLLPGVEPDFESNHVKALWIKVEARKPDACTEKFPGRNKTRSRLNRFWLSFLK